MSLDKLQKVCDLMGGTHEPQDIIDAVRDGRMQGFVENDSWFVTQVSQYPRKKILDVYVVIGTMEDLDTLRQRVVKYAQGIHADYIRVFGRPGWRKKAREYGWKTIADIVVMEVF